MPDAPVPVEEGQVRKGAFGVYWGVLSPHPRRKGFWGLVSHEFPYPTIWVGRREVEGMPLADLYSDSHPGLNYWRSFQRMVVSDDA